MPFTLPLTVARGSDEAIDLRLAYLEGLIDGGDLTSAADLELEDNDVVTINRFSPTSPLSPGLYAKVEQPGNVEPTHSAKFQSGDGYWFELMEVNSIRPEMFGHYDPDAADHTALFTAMIAYPHCRTVMLGAATYKLESFNLTLSTTTAGWEFIGIPGKTVFQFAGTSVVTNLMLVQVNDVSVSGITFQSTKYTYSGQTIPCSHLLKFERPAGSNELIRLERAGALVQNCRFIGGTAGLNFTNVRNGRARGIYCNRQQIWGISLSAELHDVVVEDFWIEHSGGEGFKISGGSPTTIRRIQVRDGTIYCCGATAVGSENDMGDNNVHNSDSISWERIKFIYPTGGGLSFKFYIEGSDAGNDSQRRRDIVSDCLVVPAGRTGAIRYQLGAGNITAYRTLRKPIIRNCDVTGDTFSHSVAISSVATTAGSNRVTLTTNGGLPHNLSFHDQVWLRGCSTLDFGGIEADVLLRPHVIEAVPGSSTTFTLDLPVVATSTATTAISGTAYCWNRTPVTLGADPIATTAASKNVVFAMPYHGLAVGDHVRVSGIASAIDGIPTEELNRLHYVTAVASASSSGGTFTIVARTAASAGTAAAGGSVVTCERRWAGSNSYAYLINHFAGAEVIGGTVSSVGAVARVSASDYGTTIANHTQDFRITNVVATDVSYGLTSTVGSTDGLKIEFCEWDTLLEYVFLNSNNTFHTNASIRKNIFKSWGPSTYGGCYLYSFSGKISDNLFDGGSGYAMRIGAPGGGGIATTIECTGNEYRSTANEALRMDDTGGTVDLIDNKVFVHSTKRSYTVSAGTVRNSRSIRGHLNASPTTTAGQVGDVFLNYAPAAAGAAEWHCTTASSGTATWKAVALAA